MKLFSLVRMNMYHLSYSGSLLGVSLSPFPILLIFLQTKYLRNSSYLYWVTSSSCSFYLKYSVSWVFLFCSNALLAELISGFWTTNCSSLTCTYNFTTEGMSLHILYSLIRHNASQALKYRWVWKSLISLASSSRNHDLELILE